MFEPEDLPAELATAVETVRRLTTGHISSATAHERATWLVGLRRLVDLTEAHFLHVLAAFDINGDGETLHASGSTAAWLRGALHLSPSDAGQRVHLSRAIDTDLAGA